MSFYDPILRINVRIINSIKMHGDSWKETKDTLLDVLAIDPATRSEYIRQLGLSPESQTEIESLIAFDSCPDSIFERSAIELAADFIAPDPTEEYPDAGRTIGKYLIVGELGIGGMGAVYLAVRNDGEISQRVAIKLLRREFNAARIREMFDREREIHSRLEHPNIARVIDAGSTDDDIPFLVMEYVDGQPIDQHCRDRRVGIIERLKLFNKVCGAVAFAHRNLIIHRDLKPSNIIVTNAGEPKLLDFGISKLLDSESNTVGETAFNAMTPEFASPEQIRGEQITTATDIYSLGAVLFRLVTGKSPIDLEGKTNGAITEMLDKVEIKAPSSLITDAAAPVIASQIRGDLDNIILKSLAAAPDRRYSTVDELSADIWRHIDGLPVLARGENFSYRSAKFIRRNKIAVTAAGLIVTSLCAGVGVSLVQADRANAQALIAETQRDDAQRASKRAEKTSKFMQSFLDYANPLWFGRGKDRLDVTVLEAIDDAAGRIDVELADEPEVQADLHYTIGNVYASQNQREKAHQHLARSLELYRQVFGERHPRVARAMWYYAISIAKPPGVIPPNVESLVRQSVEMMRETGPEDINLPYMMQTLGHYSMILGGQTKDPGLLAEAEQLFLEARTLFVRHYDEHHGSTTTITFNLTELALTRGDLAEAERQAESAVQEFEQWNSESPGKISAYQNRGRTQLANGKRAEADRSFDTAIELARKRYKPDDHRLTKVIADVEGYRIAKSDPH